MQPVDELIAAIAAATPEPPRDGTDAIEVLQRAQKIAAEREPLIAELKRHLGDGDKAQGALGEALQLIRERSERWEAALRRARHEMGQRLAALGRIDELSRLGGGGRMSSTGIDKK